MVINILNTYTVYLIYAGLRGIFSYLDFREVLMRVVSSSHKVANTLIIKTTSCVKLMLVEEVVKVIVAMVVEIV
jgi:hypothetical protein